MFTKTDHDLSHDRATLDIAALKYVADVAMGHILNELHTKTRGMMLDHSQTIHDEVTAEGIERLAHQLSIVTETRSALYGTDTRSVIRHANHATEDA